MTTVLLLGLCWNQCARVRGGATVITAGGIRLSVTSQLDSLITNAAKDLLVYQSEPLALAFPSGDGAAITMNPLAHVTQTLFLQRPGHTRAKTITTTPSRTLHPPALPLMSMHACTEI